MLFGLLLDHFQCKKVKYKIVYKKLYNYKIMVEDMMKIIFANSHGLFYIFIVNWSGSQ